MKTSRQVASASSVVEDLRHEAGDDVAMNLLSSATFSISLVDFNLCNESRWRFVAVSAKDQNVNLNLKSNP